jgi:hypothetical protein
MRQNWLVNVLLLFEEAVRLVMGMGLILFPLVAIDQLVSEPYCDVAHADHSALKVENATFLLCGTLVFFLRAFGWFNVAFGLFVEIGRRQLSQTNNRTGSFVAVTWLTHVCGFLFELFLKPAGTTNLPSVLWHASFAILYCFSLYQYAN